MCIKVWEILAICAVSVVAALGLVSCISSSADASMPGTMAARADYIPGKQSGVAIAEATPIAVTDTTKYSDPVCIGGGQSDTTYDKRRYAGAQWFSLYYDIDVATAASITVEFEVSRDGTNFYACNPAASFTVAADEVKVKAISIPACQYIRVKFTKDASDRAYDVDALEIWRY